MTPVWIALAAIAAMLTAGAVQRFPIWNPLYFFGVLFALQIGPGFVFVERLGMEAPPGFSLPLLGAYLLTLGIFLAFSVRDRDLVVGSPDLRRQLRSVELGPRTVRALIVLLACVVVHNTAVNLVLILEWGTLPAIAYDLHRHAFALGVPGVTLPQDVAAPFTVPFFSGVADHLVNPAVVIYMALLFFPKMGAPAERTTGFGSMPWPVHAMAALVLLNALIVHRRSPLLMGLATAILLLYLVGRLSRRTLLVGGLALVVVTVAAGQLRRGTSEFRAAQDLELPPVAGNTMVYEPLVYLGSGIPNFLRYWSEDHPPADGALLLSSLFPRPVDRTLGLDVNRTELLRRMFDDGFVISGQTLRTPWFEAFFDFGWKGVYLLAVLFPVGVHWLYRRTLEGPARGAPSLAFFALAKVIYLFPFIYVLFQLPFWTAAGMAVLIDVQLGRAARRVEGGSPARTVPA